MDDNKISVIIPVYNVEHYLKRCLDSVVRQSYQNLEIILIDDGSTDSSGMICDEYALKDSRVIVKHIKNQGVSFARNLGLDICSGKYIGFVDSDDWLDLDMYSNLFLTIQSSRCEIAVCGYRRVTDDYVSIVQNNNVYKVLDYKESMNMLLNYNSNYFCGIWNKLYTKKIISNYKFKEGLCLGEDLLFNFNIYFNTRCNTVFIEKQMYKYYIRSNSLCNSYAFKKTNLDEAYIWNNIYCALAGDMQYRDILEKIYFQVQSVILNILKKLCNNMNVENKVIFTTLKQQYAIFLCLNNTNMKNIIKVLTYSLPYSCSCLCWKIYKLINRF